MSINQSKRIGTRSALWSRLPELCGVIWLAVLAAAIWKHTHSTAQAPIYDSFSYYAKAYKFWHAVHAGRWFNPLNLQPTFRPPGTILMSYPFGFASDPRGFYFRSVYFPAFLLFSSVLIAAYRIADDVRTRWRTILTAIFFTTITLIYHFEYPGGAGGYWGLVDGFLTGLAALAAAIAWRGTRLEAAPLAWAATVSLASAMSIMVKPSGVFVAAIAGAGWMAFTVEQLAGVSGPLAKRLRVKRRLIVGAALIGLVDAVFVAAALGSGYLSRENLAFGQNAIAIMKAELRLPLSLLWLVVNTGIGGAFPLWAALAAIILTCALLTHRSMVAAGTLTVVLLASLSALSFGVWFWFIGSGGATQIRYALPFFAMAGVWLVPPTMRAWPSAPTLLKLSTFAVMIAAPLNLILVLLVPHPSAAWQNLTGVSVTAAPPTETIEAFKRLSDESSGHPPNVYIISFDENDAILDSIVNQKSLLREEGASLVLHRPVDWVRPATLRVAEIIGANTLIINPGQATWAPPGSVVHNLAEEQGVLTAWADKLDASDGVAVFFSAPSTKILNIVDRVKFADSLNRLVARYGWDPTFAEANHLGQGTDRP
jgi:hypothetical protein